MLNMNKPEAAARRRESKSNAKNALEIMNNALSDLSGGRKTQVRDRLLEMPVSYRNRYVRAVLGRSPTTAIEAYCFECVGWQRGHVRDCTAKACPLWPYRPERGDEK